MQEEISTRTPALDLPRRVRHVMTTKVTTVGPDDDLALALQMMLWSSIRHLPVVDHDVLVGIITDHDLLVHRRSQAGDGYLRRRVREVMRHPVETVHPNDDVRAAAARMTRARVHCLPVVMASELVGIVTSSDILADHGRAYAEGHRGPRVADVMTPSPFSYSSEARLFDVVLRMVREGIRHLPIVDSEQRVVGIITDRDLRVVLGDPVHALARSEDLDLDDLTAAHAMTPHPVVIRSDASLNEFAQTLLDEEVGAIPVVNLERRLVGIASYVDLLRYAFGT